MNASDPYSDHRFDDRLNEHDARNRQDARRRAAEARSHSRSHQEGSYASGYLSPTSRHSTRRPRSHYDAREEFARLDEEAQAREAERSARLHGGRPHYGADDVHSGRFGYQTDERKVAHSFAFDEREPNADLARERARERARQRRQRAEEDRHRRMPDERDDRRRRMTGESRSTAQQIAEGALGVLGELASRIPFLSSEPSRPASRNTTRSSFDEPYDPTLEEIHLYEPPRTARRPELGMHRVGMDRTRPQWKSRQRTSSRQSLFDRNRAERGDGGFSIQRDQVNLNPLSRRSRAGLGESSRMPSLATVMKIAIVILVIAVIALGGWRIAQAQTVVVTVNGTETSLGGSQDLNALLASGVQTEAGDLLAIDGSVISEGGGWPVTATVNGRLVTDYGEAFPENANIQLSRGGDITETSHVEDRARAIVPEETGCGPVRMVTQEGTEGRENVTVGDVSGIATTNEVTDEGTPRTYSHLSVDVGEDKVIALTFDDGPSAEYTQQILDVLKEHGAKATFFTVGYQIEKDQRAELVKRAFDEGHQICTHTYDHAAGSGQSVNLGYMTAEEQRAEIQKGLDAIQAATGSEPSRAFRAPGGNFALDVWRNVEDLISAEIGWNVDTRDWKQPGVDAIADALLQAKSGDIVLMHDGGGDRQQTVDALKKALPKLKEQGFRLITIDELLEYPLA